MREQPEEPLVPFLNKYDRNLNDAVALRDATLDH